jgi:hypothetical protein
MGHQFVNPDCRRLTPTNAVKTKNQGLTSQASSSVRQMNVPAINLNARSMVMVAPFQILSRPSHAGCTAGAY